MDYLDVVLKSITEKANWEHLEKYFLKEFKKAQKEEFEEVELFFAGCQSVIEEWEQAIKDRYTKRREQLVGLTIIASSAETKEQCEAELNDMRLEDFPLNLAIQTNHKAVGLLKHSELQRIKRAISETAERFGVKQSHADTAYEITTPILEAILSTDNYHSFKYAIDEKGFYIIRRDDQRIKVYSPELMAIFTTENLPVLERNKKTDTTINGKDYLEFYLKGYNEGATYFKENYTLPPNVLYGENAKPYVMDLHHNCFHKEIRFGFNGWYSFKKSYPTLISQKMIKEFGYYAGIISMVEELASNHPRLFETFENCEQSENSESGIKEGEVQKTAKGKPKQETPKTFDELFYNTDLVKPCIDILKELDPPLIDTDYNYIGKLKGVFCVWINEMQRQGIVKHYSDRKIFASLIPTKIKHFSIDESMFGKYQSKAEDLYRTDIKTKVSKIKLSQNSQ